MGATQLNRPPASTTIQGVWQLPDSVIATYLRGELAFDGKRLVGRRSGGQLVTPRHSRKLELRHSQSVKSAELGGEASGASVGAERRHQAMARKAPRASRGMRIVGAER
jgi:hypothetical protein